MITVEVGTDRKYMKNNGINIILMPPWNEIYFKILDNKSGKKAVVQAVLYIELIH